MSFTREAGKGSAPRKAQDQEKYSEGYDRIFGKDKEKSKDKTKEGREMTDTQPDALGYAIGLASRGFVAEASELRRLHSLNQELLKALKEISAIENQEWGADWEEIEQATLQMQQSLKPKGQTMTDTITLSRSVVEQALDAWTRGCPPDCKDGMTDSGGVYPWGEPVLIRCPACRAFDALRAALEQPQVEQEPVAEITGMDEYGPMLGWHKHWAEFPVGTKLHTHPQPPRRRAAATSTGAVAAQEREPIPNVMMDLGWELHGSNDPYQSWCMAVEWTERAHGIGGDA